MNHLEILGSIFIVILGLGLLYAVGSFVEWFSKWVKEIDGAEKYLSDKLKQLESDIIKLRGEVVLKETSKPVEKP